MKFLSLLLVLILMMPCYAGTLVKYDKQTGNIIQTNDGLDKIPSDEILNDRFISETTDVIFIEGSVDITKKRVIDKQLIDIPQAELNNKKQQAEAEKQKKAQDRKSAEEKLKVLGFTKEEIDSL